MKRTTYYNKLGYPNSLVGLIKGKRSKVIDIQLPDDEPGIIRSIDRHSVESIETPEKIEVEKPEKQKI